MSSSSGSSKRSGYSTSGRGGAGCTKCSCCPCCCPPCCYCPPPVYMFSAPSSAPPPAPAAAPAAKKKGGVPYFCCPCNGCGGGGCGCGCTTCNCCDSADWCVSSSNRKAGTDKAECLLGYMCTYQLQQKKTTVMSDGSIRVTYINAPNVYRNDPELVRILSETSTSGGSSDKSEGPLITVADVDDGVRYATTHNSGSYKDVGV